MAMANKSGENTSLADSCPPLSRAKSPPSGSHGDAAPGVDRAHSLQHFAWQPEAAQSPQWGREVDAVKSFGPIEREENELRVLCFPQLVQETPRHADGVRGSALRLEAKLRRLDVRLGARFLETPQ